MKELTLTLDEAGLLCNLLYITMRASGLPFDEQRIEVRRLSDKLARFHAELGGYEIEEVPANDSQS
jgi:hypothetical protein